MSTVLMSMDEIVGGDGSRQPSEVDLAGARHLGRRVAETAVKLAA